MSDGVVMEVEVTVRCTVNGAARELEVNPSAPLLNTLREDLYLTGTKVGCEEGECGACTVLIDGQPVDSCIYPTGAVEGREVRTVEGLSGPDAPLGLLQQAFLDNGAVQCGFCTPGLLMTLTALLEVDPQPAPDVIRRALDGNICRCTGYQQVIEAVVAAAGSAR